MAIDLTTATSGATSGLQQALGILGLLAPYLIACAILIPILVIVYFRKKYNREVLLLKITGPGFKKISDKAKLIKDKNGVGFWKLQKTKLIVDVPPSECLLPGDKGEFALGYVNSIGEVIWSMPGYNPYSVMEKIEKNNKLKEMYKKNPQSGTPELLELDAFEKDVETFLKSYKPVSTNQRASYSYQLDQAKSELKLDFLKQNISLIISALFFIILIVVLGMMWGKYWAPINERAGATEGFLLENARIEEHKLQMIDDIYGKVQHIDDVVSRGQNNNTRSVPPSIIDN